MTSSLSTGRGTAQGVGSRASSSVGDCSTGELLWIFFLYVLCNKH